MYKPEDLKSLPPLFNLSPPTHPLALPLSFLCFLLSNMISFCSLLAPFSSPRTLFFPFAPSSIPPLQLGLWRPNGLTGHCSNLWQGVGHVLGSSLDGAGAEAESSGLLSRTRSDGQDLCKNKVLGKVLVLSCQMHTCLIGDAMVRLCRHYTCM